MYLLCSLWTISDIWNPYRKSDLEETPVKTQKQSVGNANLQFYWGHRWPKMANEVVSWFFQYNSLQHRQRNRLWHTQWGPLYVGNSFNCAHHSPIVRNSAWAWFQVLLRRPMLPQPALSGVNPKVLRVSVREAGGNLRVLFHDFSEGPPALNLLSAFSFLVHQVHNVWIPQENASCLLFSVILAVSPQRCQVRLSWVQGTLKQAISASNTLLHCEKKLFVIRLLLFDFRWLRGCTLSQ